MAEGAPAAAVERGYQSSRVASRRILWIAAGLVGVILLACLAAYGLLYGLGSGVIRGWVQPTIDARAVPPAPRLESKPAATLPGYLQEQQARLHRYRWVDREAGIVQIPIERAMQILATDAARPPSPAGMAGAASRPTAARMVLTRADMAHVTRRRDAATRAHDPAREVGFDQRLGVRVPLQAWFRDANGRVVRLGDLVGRRPAVLVMTYYECPNLCTLVLNGLVSGLRQVTFDAGKQFNVITISISPRDTPQLAHAKKAAYVAKYGRPNAAGGWHFLTGTPEQIATVAHTIGFRYFYDENSRQYAHAAGIVLLTADGRIARYMPGVAFPAQELRLGLVEASSDRIGTLTDRLWLLCYHYDPSTGRYSLLVEAILRLAALATAASLGGLILLLLWRERARRRAASTP